MSNTEKSGWLGQALASTRTVWIALLVLVAVGILQEVLTNQQVQAQLLVAILILALLWWLFLQLPHFIQNMFRSLWRKPKKDKDRHSH